MVPGLLSGHHTGRIHSVFHSSLNLQIGDRLIHIGDGKHGLCCFGMILDEESLQVILRSCREGNLAVVKKDGLYLYTVSRVVILEIHQFSEVDLKIPRMKAPEQLETLLIYRQLEAMEADLELGLNRDSEFERYAGILAASSEDERDLEEAVYYFLGRGIGLTPSGDDILTGYGAVLQAFGRAELLVHVLRGATVKTTEVSRAYLTSMMDGYANEYFCDMILQIFCKEVLKLQELLCRIEKIGNTSGRDTLYGIYLGFRKIKEAYIV